MGEWILNIALVSFVIYKLGSLTELDLGRGWLHLKFERPPTKLNRTKSPRRSPRQI